MIFIRSICTLHVACETYTILPYNYISYVGHFIMTFFTVQKMYLIRIGMVWNLINIVVVNAGYINK